MYKRNFKFLASHVAEETDFCLGLSETPTKPKWARARGFGDYHRRAAYAHAPSLFAYTAYGCR